MIPKFDDLKDRAKYRKILKAELTGLTTSPAVWVLFDKFKFNDKVAPLLLVGDMANKVPFEAAKDTNAPIKGRGKCVKQGQDVAFAEDMGSLPLDKLTDDFGSVACKVVKSLATGSAPAPSDQELKSAAEKKLELSRQQFEAVKARVTDEERKDMRIALGKAIDAMDAGRYAQAITELKAMEQLMAQAGNQLRRDAQKKEDQAASSLENVALALAPKVELASHLAKTVREMSEQITRETNAKTAKEGLKSKGAQETVKRLAESLKGLNQTLPVLQEQLKEARKDRNADQGKLKELEAQLEAAHEALALGKVTLTAPGRIADKPELQQASDAISGKVGEMSEAVKWQQAQVKSAQSGVNTHGTGRHGAQTGLERQGQRLSSDVTPDQARNEGGTASLTRQWRTHKFEIVKTPEGKQKVEKPTKVVQAVIEEIGRTMATRTTSMFLNPVLEKEAVDRALAIAKQAQDWQQWSTNGTDWRDLTSLTVVVPSPKTAKGYGLSIEQSDAITKKSAVAAAALIKEFDTGKIKSIDELFEKLEVQIKTDETGVGALLIPRAKVVLERASVNAAWASKTHYPTADPQGWECAKSVTLNDKRVRGPNVPAKVAGAYTP